MRTRLDSDVSVSRSSRFHATRFFPRASRSRREHCPLFVRVPAPTDSSWDERPMRKRADSIGVNWEELLLLPPMKGLENHNRPSLTFWILRLNSASAAG